MSKSVLTIMFVFLIFFCNAQKYYVFIGEIRLDLDKWNLKNELKGAIPYEFFDNKYNVNLFFPSKRHKDRIPLLVKKAPKETYITRSDDSAITEIRIYIPIKDYPYGTSIPDLEGEIDEKKGKAGYPLKSIKIDFPDCDQAKSPADSTIDNRFIDNHTFKLKYPILIHSPEAVTVPIILDYLDQSLYHSYPNLADYTSILREFEVFREMKSTSTQMSYSQLMDFFKLLNFIEPFVLENSFLNDEARQLKLQIAEAETLIADSAKYYKSKATLSSLKNIKLQPNIAGNVGLDSTEIDRRNELINNYPSMKETYTQYEAFFKKLKSFYDQLQMVLFLRTPAQLGYRDLNYYFKTNTNDLRRNNNKEFQLALGTQVSYGLSKSYNVSVSRFSDSLVHIDTISRINACLSVGILWKPFTIKKQMIVDGHIVTSPEDSQSLRKSFVLGLFGNYYLAPTAKQLYSSLPFGISIGVGAQVNNWTIMGTVGLREIRAPRQYVINLNGQRTTFGNTIDANDNSIFVDKSYFSAGISLAYGFDKKRIRNQR